MPLDPGDVKLLWDMLDAAQRVVRYVDGMDGPAFIADDKTQGAVERRVEVIGEAARKIGEPTRTALPGIAWTAIVGTRHILAHEYGRIDPAQMWRIATVHVPALIAELARVLKDYPPRPSASKDPGST